MCIPKTSGKDNPDVYTIFSEAYLKNLSLEQLILLNHFYINRISKEFEAVKNALFVIDSLNLYPDIIDGEENIGYNIPEEILYNELLKISLLQIPQKNFLVNHKQKQMLLI